MTMLEENTKKASAYLARFRESGVPNQIAGKAVFAASGKTFESITPTDLSKLADVALGDAADVDAAAHAAHDAMASWAGMAGTDGLRPVPGCAGLPI